MKLLNMLMVLGLGYAYSGHAMQEKPENSPTNPGKKIYPGWVRSLLLSPDRDNKPKITLKWIFDNNKNANEKNLHWEYRGRKAVYFRNMYDEVKRLTDIRNPIKADKTYSLLEDGQQKATLSTPGLRYDAYDGDAFDCTELEELVYEQLPWYKRHGDKMLLGAVCIVGAKFGVDWWLKNK